MDGDLITIWPDKVLKNTSVQLSISKTRPTWFWQGRTKWQMWNLLFLTFHLKIQQRSFQDGIVSWCRGLAATHPFCAARKISCHVVFWSCASQWLCNSALPPFSPCNVCKWLPPEWKADWQCLICHLFQTELQIGSVAHIDISAAIIVTAVIFIMIMISILNTMKNYLSWFLEENLINSPGPLLDLYLFWHRGTRLFLNTATDKNQQTQWEMYNFHFSDSTLSKKSSENKFLGLLRMKGATRITDTHW